MKSSLPEANRHHARDTRRDAPITLITIWKGKHARLPQKKSGQAIPALGAGQVMAAEKKYKK